MRIQQIIEFKLKGPEALSHYMYSYNWFIFMTYCSTF